jgi:GTPase involved in cell partitioning and DNA repair
MLIGIELAGKSIFLNQLIVVGHLRIADYLFITVVLFGEHPDMRGTGNVLRD